DRLVWHARVPFGSGAPSSQLLADSFYNGIDRPLNQQLGQQSYLFGQSTVPLPPWGQQLGSTLVPAGHPHSQPVGGPYDSRPALLVPGEPGGQQPVGGGWPSYGTSVLFTPVLPSGPLHSQPTPSSLAIMPLGGDMGTLQTKSTTDPAATRLIDDLAKIKALPLYSIVVQNCISMGNPCCTKVLRILQSTEGKKALGLSRTSGLKGADSFKSNCMLPGHTTGDPSARAVAPKPAQPTKARSRQWVTQRSDQITI
ncbi:hypothetical protein T492DRAFT_1044203, partial [Pavlovales sp. CCMP2436]